MSYTSGSRPLKVRVDVASQNGVAVDFFITKPERYRKTLNEYRSRSTDGVYGETHEVIQVVKDISVPANGSYIFGVRHADGPLMNLFSKDAGDAMVTIKVYFVE